VEARLAAAPGAQVPVVITLADQVEEGDFEGRPTALIRALRTEAERTQGQVTDDLDGPSRRFWLVNALATRVSSDELAALANDPAVASVELDPQITITADAGAAGTQTSWGVPAVGAPEAWRRYGVTGAGVRIGSIDTGVDATNPELAGAVVAWRDFVAGAPAPYDDNGHGTHTIGTMVARNVGGTIGVAPGAQVVVAKAIRGDGVANGSDLLAAAQWMTDPDGDPATADFPAVVNNSWTASGAQNEWFRPMIQTWVAMGIVPVFGAGNSGETIGNPASYPEAIAVGSLEESGAVASNSSHGLIGWTIDGAPAQVSKPDITAPGVYINSTVGTGYGLYSGSSMAAPHVAGTVALLKQARPDLDVAGVRELLRTGAVDRGAPGHDLSYGAGTLNTLASVAATGAPVVDASSAPVAAARRARARIRDLRVVRRKGVLIVTGRVTGPARMRVAFRRAGTTVHSVTAAKATSVKVHRGRFVARLRTRGMARGRYVLVVAATDGAGVRLTRATRSVRLR
jgi:subtilisin family serine protease